MIKKYLQTNLTVLKILLPLNILASGVGLFLCALVIFLGYLNNQRFDIFTVNPNSKFAYFSFVILAVIFALFLYIFIRAFIILLKRKVEKFYLVKLASILQLFTSLGFLYIGLVLEANGFMFFLFIIGAFISFTCLIFTLLITTDDLQNQYASLGKETSFTN